MEDRSQKFRYFLRSQKKVESIDEMNKENHKNDNNIHTLRKSHDLKSNLKDDNKENFQETKRMQTKKKKAVRRFGDDLTQ